MITELLAQNNFRFRDGLLSDNFIEQLRTNDVFSFHCRDFIKYLGFKRCDKNFRERFGKWLHENNIDFVITNQHLTQSKLNHFFNAAEIVRSELDKPYYSWSNGGEKGGNTPRKLYEWLIETKQTEKTFDELVQQGIEIHKKIYSIEIKDHKQELSGAFNGGCWLILWKKIK